MALYTPTGLDILTKVFNKDARTSELLKTDKMHKYVGQSFTFFKFLDMLVQCACIGLADTNGQGQSNQQMLLAEMTCMLLERMELSQGFA